MTSLLPGALWKPVVNHSGPMTAHNGLVLHVQDGDNSPFGWFDNPASEASSHWWVAKDGTIEQYVDADLEAWAQESGNSSYNSVETEGLPAEPLTAQQIESVASILVWGHGRYGWPIQPCSHGGQGFTTHAFYPSGTPDPAWGDHPCPGNVRTGQVPIILATASQMLAPPIGEPVNFVAFNVTAADDHSFSVDENGVLWEKYWTPAGGWQGPVQHATGLDPGTQLQYKVGPGGTPQVWGATLAKPQREVQAWWSGSAWVIETI